MAEKSKKPTGLAIHRQGRKFTFSWKIGAKDYDDGQKVGYNLGYPKNKVMTYMKNVGTKTTSKSIKIDESKYYPNKKKKLNRVQFGVEGNRDGSKYTWSGFSGKDFILKVPQNAKAYVADSDAADNKAVFGWKVVTSDTSERYFVDVEWESVLIRNCTFKATEGKKAFAKATAKVGTKKKGTSKNATGSTTITEDSSDVYDLANNSYTRWFRVRARGPRGHSKKWTYTRYIHGQPGITKNVKPQVKVLASSYEVTVKWSSVRSPKQPIDKMVVQYVKATPNDVDLGYTSDSGWTDARTIAPKDGTDAAHFTVDGLLDSNQCLYVRINTYHDGYVTNGAPILALAGRLSAPTSMTANYNSGTNKVSVSISGGTTVPGAFHAVLVGNGFDAPVCIGIIPSGSSSVTNVSCPPDFDQSDNFFGVYAVVGEYAYNSAISYGIYDVAPILASSETLWQTGSVLVKPSNVKAVQAEGKEDTARVSWDWNWEGATGAELSWADHDDAWESTDEPSKYSVEIINAPHWNISNLETGKKWYIRVRFYKTEGDSTFYGMWSDVAVCDLSSAPNIPVLELSAEAVAAGGEFVATWVYTTNDGTPQAYASICEATIANGTVTYGDEVANAQTEQRVVLNVDELMANHGWSVGNTYYLCVKVRSESGHDSDGWSEPMPIRLVEPLECIITSTSLVEEEIEVNPRSFEGASVAFETDINEDFTKLEVTISATATGCSVYVNETAYSVSWASEVGTISSGTYDFITGVLTANSTTYQLDPQAIETEIGENIVYSVDGNVSITIVESLMTQSVLTELPLTITVDGAGDDGQTRVAIQRAQAFYLDRPDESQKTGYLDETVLLEEQAGEAEIVFDVDDDFLGTLDDGAAYKIVATISDAFGQRATIEPPPEFVVRWDHQAVVPEATVVADQDEQIVKITPTVPQGADVRNTDVIDIYRLSIDKPKLIYQDAKIGETYVDPYPTIGEYGGHRVVFRTQEGDTTTADKEMAWTDYHERIDTMYNIIEFGTGRLDLIYNIKVNSSWEKDFSQVAYLNGSIIGDWKAGVKRSGDISSVLITTMDQEMLQQLRRLAEYEGLCHVRTREGSSYAANVEVSINQDMGQNVQIAEVSLSIDRVDSDELDGMTLEDWEEGR